MLKCILDSATYSARLLVGNKIFFLVNIYAPQKMIYTLLLHVKFQRINIIVSYIRLFQLSLWLLSTFPHVFLNCHTEVELECCDRNADQTLPPPPHPLASPAGLALSGNFHNGGSCTHACTSQHHCFGMRKCFSCVRLISYVLRC